MQRPLVGLGAGKVLGAIWLGLAVLQGFAPSPAQGQTAAAPAAPQAQTPPGEVVVPVANAGDAVSAEFRLGSPAPVTITLVWADGKSHPIRVTAGDDKFGSEKTGVTVIPAATLTFQGMNNLRYFIRPRALRYTDKQQKDLLETWLAMPSALEKFVKFQAIPDAGGVAIYLDDRYASRFDNVTLQALRFTLPAGASVRNERSFKHQTFDKYLPINYAAVAQPGAMKEAKVSLPTGLGTVGEIPMVVADGAGSGDMSLVKQMKGSWAMECDEYLSRTTFDGMPESQLITVPQAFYHRAWVLFAVDPDPKKDPTMTVRLTRFAGNSQVGRGSGIADAAVPLPRDGAPLPEQIKRVGTVRHGDAELPLYLARVDLPIGEMLDLITTDTQDKAADLKIGPYLDFEILGRCGGIAVQSDTTHKPTGAPSAAHIFGVTLERAPAELRLAQSQPGNIFHNDETPETTATIKAREKGQYTLGWEISDVAGKPVRKDSKSVSLDAGQEASLPIPLAMPEVGYYGLKFTFSDPAGEPILVHDAAFALLGKDTREAGLESPYSVWWFGGSHLTTGDIELAGPLHLKAGFRKTVSKKYSEAEMAPWKLTLASFGYPFRGARVNTFDENASKVEETLKQLRERYPSCNNVLIFHEGLPNTRPEELAGVEPTFDDKAREALEQRAQLANRIGQFYREKFPDLKVIVGNNSGSAKVIADLFRFGFDRKNADYIGIEAPSQTIMPEAITEHGIMATWMSRELARKYGHEIPMTGTYEFTYRRDRAIGAQTQAEFYVRDALISHAFNFDHIGPGALDDQGGSYFNTYYGNIGIVRRTPLLYPKPSYVALANATKVLDKAELSRVLKTGSLTVYAIEMRRERSVKDFAYAMWTPRGDAELTYDFGKDLTVTFVDFYGRTKPLKTAGGKLTVPTSTAATYLIAPEAASTVSVSQRTFPNDQPPSDYKPANRMETAAEWETVTDEKLTSIFRKPGNFTLRQTTDPEKGPCLELELTKAPGLEPMVGEHVSLKLKQPVEVPGTPHTMGLWVKGNSNWGKLRFQIMDRDGNILRSNAEDWPATLAVNFDGWSFMRFCIDPQRSPITNMSPGAAWTGKLTYPIKIVGLDVTMHQKALDPVEMRDVTPVLRFKDIGAYE